MKKRFVMKKLRRSDICSLEPLTFFVVNLLLSHTFP